MHYKRNRLPLKSYIGPVSNAPLALTLGASRQNANYSTFPSDRLDETFTVLDIHPFRSTEQPRRFGAGSMPIREITWQLPVKLVKRRERV
jgi:hypothetical protein